MTKVRGLSLAFFVPASCFVVEISAMLVVHIVF